MMFSRLSLQKTKFFPATWCSSWARCWFPPLCILSHAARCAVRCQIPGLRMFTPYLLMLLGVVHFHAAFKNTPKKLRSPCISGSLDFTENAIPISTYALTLAMYNPQKPVKKRHKTHLHIGCPLLGVYICGLGPRSLAPHTWPGWAPSPEGAKPGVTASQPRSLGETYALDTGHWTVEDCGILKLCFFNILPISDHFSLSFYHQRIIAALQTSMLIWMHRMFLGPK